MKTPILDIAKVVRSKNSGPFELTMDRPMPSGVPGETDVYGAQQHAPLLKLVFDL